MKRIDKYTKVMRVPNGLLFLRSHNWISGVATHMLHVPCDPAAARAFLESLPDWGGDE